MTRIRIVLIILCFAAMGQAQYYDEQVIEKSFEKSDFFFQPVQLNPYQIGQFGNALPGLVDDLLLNLKVNPACLVGDMQDDQYIYIDFRNSRDKKQNSVNPWYGGCYDCYMPFPVYYMDSRKELEPVISTAFFTRPWQKTPLVLGMTYQLLIQDEDYYAVPYDVYKSNVGLDYNGAEMSADRDMPITDRYSGDDMMEQEGHFLSFAAGLSLSSRLHAGLRIGRVLFDRSGAYGSTNVYNSNYSMDSESNNHSLTERNQDYDHWNTSLGLQFDLSKNTLLGVKTGYLSGLANQTLVSTHESLYSNGVIDQGKGWSYYYQSSLNDQVWNHDGKSIYAGAHIESHLQSNAVFFAQYMWLGEDVDCTSSGTVADTAYSNYYYADNAWRSRSESHSAVDDARTGIGGRSADRHDLTAGLRFTFDQKTKVSLGIHVEKHDVMTETVESVTARRQSESSYSNQDEWNNSANNYFHSVREKKELNWDLEIHSMRFQIPIILTHQFNKRFEVMFGINRSINRWEIEDKTLAVFDYRDKNVNGETENKTDFGERYTQPREKRSDVKTGILGGITVRPSDQFDIRLMMAPHYTKTWQGTQLQEFQWWISMNLHLKGMKNH